MHVRRLQLLQASVPWFLLMSGLLNPDAPLCGVGWLLQEAGLKVKEFELLRRNFSDSGNFGARARTPSSPSNPVCAVGVFSWLHKWGVECARSMLRLISQAILRAERRAAHTRDGFQN